MLLKKLGWKDVKVFVILVKILGVKLVGFNIIFFIIFKSLDILCLGIVKVFEDVF